MNTRIKILAIAPYESMKTLLMSTAREFPDIEMTVIVGDLKVGLDLTMNQLQSNYDVLLSRGGTAKLLRQFLTLPVVEIKISGNDILRTLNLANAHHGRSAVVGFSNITHEMEKIQSLLPYSVDTFSIDNTDEALSVLYQLTNSNYSALLCDMVTHTAASKLGMNTFLITSGAESIREAIREAIFMYQANQQLQMDNQFFRTLLQHQNIQTIVFSDTGKLVYSTQRNEQTDLLHLLRKRIHNLPSNDQSKLVLQSQGIQYHVLPRSIQVQDQHYVAFHYSAIPISDAKARKGIRYLNRDQVEDVCLRGPYSMIEFPSGLSHQLHHAAEQLEPILLIGEPGAGQRHAAHLIYLESERSNHPLIEIDCSVLKSKNWSYLINHHSSPLYDTGSTLHFENAETLTGNQLQTLCSFFSSNEAMKQNTLIFSASTVQGADFSATETLLHTQLRCRVLSLMPLRNFPQLIFRFVNRYLHLYRGDSNPSEENTDPLIAPEALQILRRYSWPQNYSQLLRVLERITDIAGEEVVTVEMVNDALGQEIFMISANLPDSTSTVLDISRPLAEIERTIARIILENNGGNHSQAAASLGISRSTLWRMLKK